MSEVIAGGTVKGLTVIGTVDANGLAQAVSAATPVAVQLITSPVTSITRDSAGRISAFTEAGISHTVTRDSAGRVATVS